MRLKIYNFNKKQGSIGNTGYQVADYFQWYTTGLEDVPIPEQLFITERNNLERYENIAYDLFRNENLADFLVAMNNDTFLWNTPLDNDSFLDSIDIMYDYIQKKNKTRFLPEDEENWKAIATEKIQKDDDILRYIIIPRKEHLQKLTRAFKDYLISRTVT